MLRFNFYKLLTIGPGNYICFAERSVHTPHPAVCSVFSTKRPPVSFTWNRAVRTCAISACGIVCREVIVARAVPRVPSCGITYKISLDMNTAIQGIGRSCSTITCTHYLTLPFSVRVTLPIAGGVVIRKRSVLRAMAGSNRDISFPAMPPPIFSLPFGILNLRNGLSAPAVSTCEAGVPPDVLRSSPECGRIHR